MKFFRPLLMGTKDAEILSRMMTVMKKIGIANGHDLAEIISIVFFVSMQRQISAMESDYDDHH